MDDVVNRRACVYTYQYVQVSLVAENFVNQYVRVVNVQSNDTHETSTNLSLELCTQVLFQGTPGTNKLYISTIL